MPSIKRSNVKAEEVKTGFEAYDGPTPTKRGMYRAIIKQFNFKEFRSGRTGFSILVELEAAAGDPHNHEQFDGFPIWSNIVFGEEEALMARESNLYAALGAGDGPTITHDEGNPTTGVKVKKVGGKDPIDKAVSVDIKQGKYEGEVRPEVDGIYKIAGAASAGKAKATADAPEPEEEDTAEDAGARERELKALKVSDLREIADELGLETDGVKKADLISSILEEEFGAEFAEPSEDDEDEEDEDEEDEEEDDEEDEEDDEEDEEAERRADLAGVSRIELKKVLKELDPDAKVLKKMTDEDIVDAIIAEEFESDEPPF